jgi:hypothetical protein
MRSQSVAGMALVLVCLLVLTLGVARGQANLASAIVDPALKVTTAPPSPTTDRPNMPPAGIYPLLSYQGRLYENGAPVNGARQMTFRVCRNEPGTSCYNVWSEGPKTITVTNGLFTTLLGDMTPLDGGAFSYGATLEVQVGSQVLPRQPLGGAPYAMTLAPGAMVYESGSSGYALHLYSYSGGGLSAAGMTTAVYANSVAGHAIDATSGSSGRDAATLHVSNTESSSSSGVAANIESTGLPPALIVHNSMSGNDLSGAALYARTNGGPAIRAVDEGESTETFSVQGNGDIRQARGADGAVKAAVYAYCANSGATIGRAFGPPGANFSISSGGTAGECTFDFGFKIDDRFFTATPEGSTPVIVSCSYIFMHEPNLGCRVTNPAGAGVNSNIMIVVY